MKISKAIKRPALRYHGGKWILAPWIVSHFPKHITYVEPFGGGASVLIRKEKSFIEVYNDLDEMVVNFFLVLREIPEDFLRYIQLTPYSRLEFKNAQNINENESKLELARKFFILSWQGRGRGGAKSPGGWRFMNKKSRGKTPVDDWFNMNHLMEIAKRLQNVHIENDNATKVITRYDTPNTLFYIDPPYPKITRSNEYRTEFSQHEELSKILKHTQGNVIISSYESELYNNLYSTWEKQCKHGQKDNAKKRNTKEIIFIKR